MSDQRVYYEQLAVEWASSGLSRFFANIGYEFAFDTVGEVREALVPLDRIYAARRADQLLLFALQFKAPLQRREVIAWKVREKQHANMAQEYFSRFGWYCLPFMKSNVGWRNILYHCLFVSPSICRDTVRSFIWDDYCLYFHPGGGGCREFLNRLRHLPCREVPIPALDARLANAYEAGWNYAITYDSWGTLFYKLLAAEAGFRISTDSDYEQLKDRLLGGDAPPLEGRAMIITLDAAKRVIEAVNVLSGAGGVPPWERGEDDFPMYREGTVSH